MEGEPRRDIFSLEEQVDLAQALSDAVDVRNDFIQRMGGFDDFADVHQYVDDNRARYDELEAVFSEARKKFDEAVMDKKALTVHLRQQGQTELADRIKSMFSVR